MTGTRIFFLSLTVLATAKAWAIRSPENTPPEPPAERTYVIPKETVSQADVECEENLALREPSLSFRIIQHQEVLGKFLEVSEQATDEKQRFFKLVLSIGPHLADTIAASSFSADDKVHWLRQLSTDAVKSPADIGTFIDRLLELNKLAEARNDFMIEGVTGPLLHLASRVGVSLVPIGENAADVEAARSLEMTLRAPLWRLTPSLKDDVARTIDPAYRDDPAAALASIERLLAFRSYVPARIEQVLTSLKVVRDEFLQTERDLNLEPERKDVAEFQLRRKEILREMKTYIDEIRNDVLLLEKMENLNRQGALGL